MAVDTKQKRMSAIMPLMPFRGPMVDATITGFTVGNRMAATLLYAGSAELIPTIRSPFRLKVPSVTSSSYRFKTQ